MVFVVVVGGGVVFWVFCVLIVVGSAAPLAVGICTQFCGSCYRVLRVRFCSCSFLVEF